MADVGDLVRRLAERGLTVGTGESLTAGLVAATMADVPGASAVLRGGVVAYAPQVKADVLGVTAPTLAGGLVSRGVAEAMADGARRATGADLGVGTTGVAGPEAHDGEPVGSVWIAVAADDASAARHLSLSGDRASIRRQTVAACWDLMVEVLDRLPRNAGD